VSGNLIVLALRDSQVAFSRSTLKRLEDPQASSVPCRAERCVGVTLIQFCKHLLRIYYVPGTVLGIELVSEMN
jgi:hypothetical protein